MDPPLRRRTPLAAVGRGLLAGAVGTAAMTAWQTLAARLQNGGGSEVLSIMARGAGEQ